MDFNAEFGLGGGTGRLLFSFKGVFTLLMSLNCLLFNRLLFTFVDRVSLILLEFNCISFLDSLTFVEFSNESL